ncbi:MAG: hypothetical protein ACFFKA_13965 [Candidatus Thorarchaeota archaeon]
MSNTENFYKILCKYSINKNPKLALLEWDFISAFEDENQCICGKDIKENCVIENKNNKNQLVVGNVCVKRFMERDYTFIFSGIKKIEKGECPNKTFINYCYENGYLFENQKSFLLKMRGNKIKNKEKDKYKELTDLQNNFFKKIIYKLKKIKNY